MGKQWRLMPHDAALVQELASRSGVSLVLAQLLVRRGLHQSDSLGSFLDPKLSDLRDPELLPGLSKAAELLYDSVQRGDPIVVYGDYDADGMTASSILLGTFKLLNANVSCHLPNRLEDGYGLSQDAIRKLAERGKRTIVTVDCGIASVEEASLCRELGLRLIITDHHQMGSVLPDADAIVHPALPGYSYPFHGLCGAGVAFKLAWALCQHASNAKKVSPELRNYLVSALGLAAIGTVADVVPLIDENRVLVKHGLKSLESVPCLGLRALMKVTKLNERSQLGAEDIAFTLGPRLNAAGRLGQAQLAVELLTTTDEARAEALANYIDKLNADRESLERSIQLAAGKQIKELFDIESTPALVLGAPGWHAGVIGVVAGRLAEKYHRPVVMVSFDNIGLKPGIGSARAPSYLNLHEALHACSEYLVSCGGHAAAAGLRIDERNLPAFRDAFCEYVGQKVGQDRPQAEIEIDVEAPLGVLDLATVRQIEQMAPFGQGNPRPILCASGVQLAEPPKPMGSGDRHFSGRFRQHGKVLRGVAFGQGEWVEKLKSHTGLLDIAFRPVINEFRGIPSVEMHVIDWRESRPQVPAPHFDQALRAVRQS